MLLVLIMQATVLGERVFENTQSASFTLIDAACVDNAGDCPRGTGL